MSIISAGDTGGVDLPEISNSLRFDGSNDYLAKTFGAPTSATKSTFFAMVKRSKLGAAQYIYSGSNYEALSFNASDALVLSPNSGTPYYTSTRVFRDPSAWIAITISIDTTLAVAADRVKVYVNNDLVAMTGGSVAQNATNVVWNASGGVGNIGRFAFNSNQYFDGYLSNVCFIDGSALNPSDFAYTDPNGQWRSLSKTALQSVVNAGGANSFFLSFDNGSSTTTLGNDASSKGNNWTLNNMVRDGSVNDCWSYDTPTNNFAVLNSASIGADATLSNAGLTIAYGSATTRNATMATIGMVSGKWYWECTVTASGTPAVGITNTASASSVSNYPGFATNGWGYVADGNKYNGSGAVAYGATYTVGDLMSVAFDADAGTLEFFKNNVSQGVAFTGIVSGTYFPAFGDGSTVGTWTGAINFGQRPVTSGQWYPDAGGYFRYAPPTGYKALSTNNLSGGAVTTSGTFTGNVAADGPFVWINGTPTAMTINGNAVTFGTHADKLANGFKLRTASTSYNNSGSNTYSVTSNAGVFKYNNAEGNP